MAKLVRVRHTTNAYQKRHLYVMDVKKYMMLQGHVRAWERNVTRRQFIQNQIEFNFTHLNGKKIPKTRMTLDHIFGIRIKVQSHTLV